MKGAIAICMHACYPKLNTLSSDLQLVNFTNNYYYAPLLSLLFIFTHSENSENKVAVRLTGSTVVNGYVQHILL